MAASSSKPRLLFVLHAYGSLTGVEHAHTLAAALQQCYDIALAYPRGDEVRLLRVGAGETAHAGGRVPWPATPKRHPALQRAFARILADFRPDLIHIQHFLNWPLSIIDQAVDSGVPVVLSFHDY
jgi:hypothetical protein